MRHKRRVVPANQSVNVLVFWDGGYSSYPVLAWLISYDDSHDDSDPNSADATPVIAESLDGRDGAWCIEFSESSYVFPYLTEFDTLDKAVDYGATLVEESKQMLARRSKKHADVQ